MSECVCLPSYVIINELENWRGAESTSEPRKGEGTKMIQENDERRKNISRIDRAGPKCSWNVEAQNILLC